MDIHVYFISYAILHDDSYYHESGYRNQYPLVTFMIATFVLL